MTSIIASAHSHATGVAVYLALFLMQVPLSEFESLAQDFESETLSQDVLCAQQNTENADNDNFGLSDVDYLRADQGCHGEAQMNTKSSLLCSTRNLLLTTYMTIASTSGVGGGASGASADAPRVGHRWQSDTDSIAKKKKGKEAKKKI